MNHLTGQRQIRADVVDWDDQPEHQRPLLSGFTASTGC